MSTQITNGVTGVTPAVTFAEAPASCNVRVVSPGGYDYQITMRSGRVADVLNQAQALESWLTTNGWTPAPTYSKPSKASPNATNGVQADAPICPTHHRSMKSGRRGWLDAARPGRRRRLDGWG